ncbi:MAG: ribosome recycling factor [Candidatus Zixiibacteriota bacterium]|nr:MAG: ribosome recycling factor [candidate division Zixibacteria bacterium]
MLEEIYKDTKERMHKTVEAMSRELGAVRTGKASPAILDNVKVEAYGSVMPLNQVASVSAPEARLLVVNAFDKTTVGDIVKAIQGANLGLNPSVDGQIIRLAIPALNEERRKELVKQCKNLAEDGKVAIRNIRRDANEQIKEEQKAKNISEDQEKDGHDEVQKFTDDHINQIDAMMAKKEKEVMEV